MLSLLGPLPSGPTVAPHPPTTSSPTAAASPLAAGRPHTGPDCHASGKEVPCPRPRLAHPRQSSRSASPAPHRDDPPHTPPRRGRSAPGPVRPRPPRPAPRPATPRWPPAPGPAPPARASPSARTRRTRSRSSPSSTVCPTKSVWSRPAAPPKEPGPAKKSSADCSSDMAAAPQRASERGARSPAASGSAQQPPARSCTIFRPDAVT